MMTTNIQRNFGTLAMMILSPLIYIAAFNQFFGTDIPWTFGSWLVIFLAEILAGLIAFAAILLGVFSGFLTRGIGFVLIFAGLLLLPVFFIFSVNLLLKTTVPITVESYLLVGLVQIGIIAMSGALKGIKLR